MSNDPEHPKALLSIRSAVIFITSLAVALVAGAMVYAIHHSLAWSGLAAGPAFVATAAFLNWAIE